MAAGFEDLYAVFLRGERQRLDIPEGAEWQVTTCATYGEARQIQRLFQRMDKECVIRFLGYSGGGD